MNKINKKNVKIGANLLILAPIFFLLFEAIVASAWKEPTYSYSYNFISDLGVPVITQFEGRTDSSPLSSWMNLGFIVYADLLVAGFCLLTHALSEKRRTLTTTLTILYGVGYTLIALFPGYEWEWGFMHGVGAVPIFFGGSAALMLYGTVFDRLIQKKWYKTVSILLVIISLIGALTCILLVVDFRGLLERIALYSMLIWSILCGSLVLENLKNIP